MDIETILPAVCSRKPLHPELETPGLDDRPRDARDYVIEALADNEAALREANHQLVDLVADLAFENASLLTVYERELIARIHADATIERLYRLLHR